MCKSSRLMTSMAWYQGAPPFSSNTCLAPGEFQMLCRTAQWAFAVGRRGVRGMQAA